MHPELGPSSPTVPTSHCSARAPLPVKDLELVVEKRRLCSDLSPASAISILQKTPADAVWTQSLTDTEASIYRRFASTNYWERHYVKALENSAGYL